MSSVPTWTCRWGTRTPRTGSGSARSRERQHRRPRRAESPEQRSASGRTLTAECGPNCATDQWPVRLFGARRLQPGDYSGCAAGCDRDTPGRRRPVLRPFEQRPFEQRRRWGGTEIAALARRMPFGTRISRAGAAQRGPSRAPRLNFRATAAVESSDPGEAGVAYVARYRLAMALGAVAADLVLLIAVVCAVQRRLIYFPLPEKLARAGPLPVLCARQRRAYWRAAARVQRPAGPAA